MKRKLFLSLTAVIIFSSLSQAHNDKNVSWGVKATADAELPTKWHGKTNVWKMFNNGFGCTLGFLSNIPIGWNFYIEPELAFYMSEYRYDLELMADDTEGNNPKLSKYGIAIPIVVGYNVDFSERFGLRIFTGPQFRYAFAGDIGIKKNLKEEYENLLLWDTNRRFDFSWKIGIGFPIDNFMISAEADFGIANLYKNSPIADYTKWTYHENRVGGGITYYF